MKRFQLTIAFVIFSAITISAGAAAINSLTGSSSARNVLAVTREHSERDAQFIAALVGQNLADDMESGPVFGAAADASDSAYLQPASIAALESDASEFLGPLAVAGIAVYDTAGGRLWTSTNDESLVAAVEGDTLATVMKGEVVSVFVEGATDAPVTEDLVVSYVPLGRDGGGVPEQVFAVSHAVPASVSSVLADSRNAVLKTTLISLSGVFVILLAFVLVADVRIWKRNELALEFERSQQESLGLQNQQLSELNESKNRFISTISHELSNPLASLVSFLDLVLRNRSGNLTERQLEQLTTARKNGDQLRRLIKDLAHAAQQVVGTLEIVNAEFEIRPVLDEVAESLSHDLHTRQQVLRVEASNDLGSMIGDRGRMLQVFSNLLSNASKYSPQGAAIRLVAETDDSALRVAVIDEGIGIAEKDIDHIFEMFWRADNPDVKGAGIGLVLAKQIIEGHGGHIMASSVPDEGTTMSFEVPLRHVAVAAHTTNGFEGVDSGEWEQAA